MKAIFLLLAVTAGFWTLASDTSVVTGQVTAVYATIHVLESNGKPMLVSGDALRTIQGKLRAGDLVVETLSKGQSHNLAQDISIVGHSEFPLPQEVSLEQLLREGPFLKPVRITGICEDIQRENMTVDSNLMTLRSGPARLQVTVVSNDRRKIKNFDRLLNAKIELTGVYFENIPTSVPYRGPVFVPTVPEATRIVDDNLPDPYAHPVFEEPKSLSPHEISAMDLRTLTGVVMACWGENQVLLKSFGKGQTQLHRLVLAYGSERPAVGSHIQIVGQPETDLYHVNFSSVRYRTLPDSKQPETDSPPPATDLKDMFRIANGKIVYSETAFGRVFRLRGTLLSRTASVNGETFTLLVDGFPIAVDATCCPNASSRLEPGSTLDVTGICILDIDNWRRDTLQSPIKGHLLVLRHVGDLKVVSLPSWWTPTRFAAVSGGLLVLLLAIVLWNLALNRAVNRKGAELKREITARLASNLKIRERTRLAVELHDSIAQTLSGTAMEIGCALQCAESLPRNALAHLQTASQTLRSCRDDLRDCLWDLRSNALETTSMDEAIRTTLRPIIGDLTPTIRFNVRRQLLSDNTAHALLRIVHELVSNAIRHGRARTISIAGSLESTRILFSVKDDGCGFDPQHHPDTADGHFGLEGIRERIRRFNGVLKIASSPGNGTKATVSLDIRPKEEEDLDIL